MILALACLAAFGCGPRTDAGTECQLLKSDGMPLTERDLGAARDLISFASPECEDQICIRDQGAPATGNLDAPVKGYCSKACVSDARCESATPLRLSCRSMLLDELTLAQICADPALCQKVGNSRSPLFCAAVR